MVGMVWELWVNRRDSGNMSFAVFFGHVMSEGGDEHVFDRNLSLTSFLAMMIIQDIDIWVHCGVFMVCYSTIIGNKRMGRVRWN